MIYGSYGFWLQYLIAVLNSTEPRTCREKGEQSSSTTWEGWAGERLSLKLRNPVSLTDLTHSFKCGSKKLAVRFIGVCSLSAWWANTAANRNASMLPLRGAEIQLSSTAPAKPFHQDPPPLPPSPGQISPLMCQQRTQQQIAALTKSRTRQRRWWTARAHTQLPRTN